MATQTENLGLRKPAPHDLVNVTTDISDNMDLIDAAIESKAVAEHSHPGDFEPGGAIDSHATDTTNVHGFVDTSNVSLVGHAHPELAPTSAINTHNADTTDVHGIPDTSLLVDNADLVAHNEDTTAVHGIANTALLITAADHASIDHDDIPGAGQIPVQDEAPVGPDLHDLWVDSDEPAISGGGGGAAIAYQPEAPEDPAEGDLWADSDEMVPAGSSVAFTDYTPSNTNITVGNGTQVARYARIGTGAGSLIVVRYCLTWGSTTSFGGAIQIGLPVAAAATGIQGVVQGNAYSLDSGTAENLGLATRLTLGSVTSLAVLGTSGISVSNTQPHTWAVNDVLAVSVMYEAGA